MGDTPHVEITAFPFLGAECANPDKCPVCQSKRCQFGRLGDMLDPPQQQCQRAATIRSWWCDEHARGARS